MDTSRIEEVKTPQHDGTPRAHLLRKPFGFFGPLGGVLRVFTRFLMELFFQQPLDLPAIRPAVLEVLGIWLRQKHNHFQFR